MRVFLSEYVCGGAWAEGVPPASLLCEGRSMLEAIAADAAAVEGWSVVATWDARLGERRMDGVEVIHTEGPDDERRIFGQLAAECDATLVIAPEFDGILLERRRIVDRAGGRFAGPAADAIALCSDKLRLAGHLHGQGIATIPTAVLHDCAFEFPLVVKPRDGAGSQRTFLVRNAEELDVALTAFAGIAARGAPVVQPYIRGRALSVAVLASAGGNVEILPVAEQLLSEDGLFQYFGGWIPAGVDPVARERVAEIVRRTCACVAGLKGYVGFDVILPDGAAEPLIVEINPRLTTSYLGYRALTEENLAASILTADDRTEPIRWQPGEVRFTRDGRTER